MYVYVCIYMCVCVCMYVCNPYLAPTFPYLILSQPFYFGDGNLRICSIFCEFCQSQT